VKKEILQNTVFQNSPDLNPGNKTMYQKICSNTGRKTKNTIGMFSFAIFSAFQKKISKNVGVELNIVGVVIFRRG